MSVKKQVYYLIDLTVGEIEKYVCTERDMIRYLEDLFDENSDFENISDSISTGDIRIFQSEVEIKFDRKVEISFKGIV